MRIFFKNFLIISSLIITASTCGSKYTEGDVKRPTEPEPIKLYKKQELKFTAGIAKAKIDSSKDIALEFPSNSPLSGTTISIAAGSFPPDTTVQIATLKNFIKEQEKVETISVPLVITSDKGDPVIPIEVNLKTQESDIIPILKEKEIPVVEDLYKEEWNSWEKAFTELEEITNIKLEDYKEFGDSVITKLHVYHYYKYKEIVEFPHDSLEKFKSVIKNSNLNLNSYFKDRPQELFRWRLTYGWIDPRYTLYHALTDFAIYYPHFKNIRILVSACDSMSNLTAEELEKKCNFMLKDMRKDFSIDLAARLMTAAVKIKYYSGNKEHADDCTASRYSVLINKIESKPCLEPTNKKITRFYSDTKFKPILSPFSTADETLSAVKELDQYFNEEQYKAAYKNFEDIDWPLSTGFVFYNFETYLNNSTNSVLSSLNWLSLDENKDLLSNLQKLHSIQLEKLGIIQVLVAEPTIINKLVTEKLKDQLRTDVTNTKPTSGSDLVVSNKTETSATLTWGAANDDYDQADTLQYKLWISTQSLENGDTANATVALDWTQNTLSKNLTGLTNGTTYYYLLQVKDTNNLTNNYTSGSFTTMTATPANVAPVVSGSVTVSDLTRNSVDLSWVAATDDQDTATDLTYRALIYTSAIDNNNISAATTALNWTANTTQINDISGLTINTTYHYLVQVKDSDGEISSYTAGTFTTLSGLRIFLTNDIAQAGNLGGIAGADAKCMADANKPTGGSTFKALIVDGTSRRACSTSNCSGTGEGIDWVLAADTAYVSPSNVTIATANSKGIFVFNLTSNLGANEEAWTGLNSNWTVASHCTNWSSTGGNGTIGNASQIDLNSISDYDVSCASTQVGLYCIEQPR